MMRRLRFLFAGLAALLSLPALAYTGGGNATVVLLGSPSANCIGWPSCPTVLNSAAAPLYTLDPTVNTSIQQLLSALAAPLPLPTGASTSALQTTGNGYLANISGRVTGNLALDSSIQSLLTTLQAPLTINLPTGASTSALQSTGNGYLLTLSTFTTSASTSALQSTGNGFLSTLATASASQATGAKQDTGNASAATTATNTGATSAAAGTTADAAYSGSGNATIIAALKGLFGKGGQNASIDGSTSQTTGGTAQALFSAVTPAHGWKVSIPVPIASLSSFACYASDAITTPSATTPGSQMVSAGGQYATEPGQKPVGPVYVNCPTTGQAISAQMW